MKNPRTNRMGKRLEENSNFNVTPALISKSNF